MPRAAPRLAAMGAMDAEGGTALTRQSLLASAPMVQEAKQEATWSREGYGGVRTLTPYISQGSIIGRALGGRPRVLLARGAKPFDCDNRISLRLSARGPPTDKVSH